MSEREVATELDQSDAARRVGEDMAMSVHDNLNAFLLGQRERFSAHFGVTQLCHDLAAQKLEELLQQNKHRAEVDMGSEDWGWEDTFNVRKHHYNTHLMQVATYGGRRVLKATMGISSGEPGDLTITDIRYYGDVVDSLETNPTLTD